jgi:hypothetical protein
MMNRWLVAYTILIAMMVSANKANAVEPLSTKELAEHCIHYAEDLLGKDAIFCVRYVQGFIDGAVATDERVAVNVAAEINKGKEESFSERAIRLRSPSKIGSRFGPTVYAEFCLGAPVKLKEVVEHVVADLKTREVLEEKLLARDAVYAVLRRDYPCETD